MNCKKKVFIFLFACSTQISYSDSIIFLPDYKETQNIQQSQTIKQSNSKNTKLDNAGDKTAVISHNMLQDTHKEALSMQSMDTTQEPMRIAMLQEHEVQVETLEPPMQQYDTKMHDVSNGSLFIAITSETNPKDLQIGNKVLKWVAHPKNSAKKIAFVPIAYRSEFGAFNIGNNIILNIKQGNYRKENIQLTDSTKAKPNQSAQDRIKNELNEANKIYATYTSERYWNTPFMLPMQSVITSPFGSARVFNNEVKSFHGGTDFRAAIGTPIKASNDGVVVIAKERFIAGKSVVISHGEGIFSMYYHCSDIKVQVGQKVKKGEVIALSGNTGRVSGPHLHFGILINGVQVNPMDFIEKINALFVTQ